VNDEANGLVISNILAKLQTNDRTHADRMMWPLAFGCPGITPKPEATF
jgi:hypothetical protein